MGKEPSYIFILDLANKDVSAVKAVIRASVKVALQQSSLVYILIIPPQPKLIEPARILKSELNP